MRDLSLHLLKNSLVSRMKKGIRAFCHGVGSTSTLKQRNAYGFTSPAVADVETTSTAATGKATGCDVEDEGEEETSLEGDQDPTGVPLTLEEMIRRLDMEEEAARRERELQQLRLHAEDYHSYYCCYSRGDPPLAPRRMSCANASSDVLRSARDAALSQYPRFSLDGRDAMYPSSFRNSATPGPHGLTPERARKSSATCGVERARSRERKSKAATLPPKVAGQNVMWCRPGVVPKLMGLEAVPMPVRPRHSRRKHTHQDSRSCRKHNHRRSAEVERPRSNVQPHGPHDTRHIGTKPRLSNASLPMGIGSSCPGGACCASRDPDARPVVDRFFDNGEEFWNFSMYNYYN